MEEEGLTYATQIVQFSLLRCSLDLDDLGIQICSTFGENYKISIQQPYFCPFSVHQR
jgi:hypothetical protein